MIGDVTEGCFREAIHIPVQGDPWRESEFWSPNLGSRGSSHWIDRYPLAQVRAQQLNYRNEPLILRMESVAESNGRTEPIVACGNAPLRV